MPDGMIVTRLFNVVKTGALGARAKNSLILSAASFTRNVFGLVSIILIARYLEPGEFGRLMFAFALAGVFAPAAAMGIERLAVRQMVAEPERTDRIAATALLLRFFGAASGLVIAVSITASGLIDDDAPPLLTAIACIALFQSAIDGLTGVLTAHEKFLHAAIPSILAAAANLGFVVFLIARPDQALALFAATRIVDAVVFILCILVAVRVAGIALPHLRPSRAVLAGFLRQGFPILLAAIAYTLFLRMDQLMLAALTDETELGVYSLSLRLAEALNFVPTVIALAFYPHLTRLYETARNDYDIELHFLFDTMAVVSAGLIGVIWIIAIGVLVPLFGEDYARSSGIAAILALAIPFIALGVARSTVFTISGHVWLPLAVWSGPVIVNLAMNLLLIPWLGAYGAAISTVFSLLVAHIGTSFLFPALRPHGPAMLRALNLFRSVPSVLRRLQLVGG
ncbi:MAG: flippase [Pseudomonadota bacterium]